MTSFGLFEASVTSDDEVRVAELAQERLFREALHEAKNLFGTYLAGAKNREGFRERFAQVKPDIKNLFSATTLPVTNSLMQRVQREILAAHPQEEFSQSDETHDEFISDAAEVESTEDPADKPVSQWNVYDDAQGPGEGESVDKTKSSSVKTAGQSWNDLDSGDSEYDDGGWSARITEDEGQYDWSVYEGDAEEPSSTGSSDNKAEAKDQAEEAMSKSSVKTADAKFKCDNCSWTGGQSDNDGTCPECGEDVDEVKESSVKAVVKKADGEDFTGRTDSNSKELFDGDVVEDNETFEEWLIFTDGVAIMNDGNVDDMISWQEFDIEGGDTNGFTFVRKFESKVASVKGDEGGNTRPMKRGGALSDNGWDWDDSSQSFKSRQSSTFNCPCGQPVKGVGQHQCKCSKIYNISAIADGNKTASNPLFVCREVMKRDVLLAKTASEEDHTYDCPVCDWDGDELDDDDECPECGEPLKPKTSAVKAKVEKIKSKVVTKPKLSFAEVEAEFERGWDYATNNRTLPENTAESFLRGYIAGLESVEAGSYDDRTTEVDKNFEPKIPGIPNALDDAVPQAPGGDTTQEVRDDLAGDIDQDNGVARDDKPLDNPDEIGNTKKTT